MADVTFERFGGLNLVSDPQEAGAEQALSCLNVALDRNGRLRTRDGYDVIYDSATDGAITNLHPVNTDVVLAALGASAVHAVDLGTGSSLANAALSNATSSFASAGDGVYFTDGTTAQIRKYNGVAFSSPAGLATYEANYLAVQPLEDRLVIADANNTSRLYFSNPDNPETITYTAGPPETGDFVELTPGDGERITGMAVYGTELFVFKETKFFVFSGNSTDPTGGSVFNYRMVDTGVGCLSSGGYKLAATHETGVYFLHETGVYRTTGGPAVRVSRAIDPVFRGNNTAIPSPFSSLVASPVSTWYQVTVAQDQLFVIGASVTFVLNLSSGEWTFYSWPVFSVLDGSLMADAANYEGTLILGGQAAADSDAFIAKSSKAFTDDDGTAISWHHQSGFYDLGSQNSKRTRQTVLWGSGTATVGVFTDHGTSDANAAAVVMFPGVVRGWHRKAYRGVLFSHKLSGSSASTTVHRIGHTVADERQGR